MTTAVTDSKLEFRDLVTNETVHIGTIDDHILGDGAFHLTFTPTLSGNFDLHIMFNGLHVDNSPYRVSVQPALATHAPSSTIVNINSMVHSTGEYLRFIIESRDQFSNLRKTSIEDVYVVTLEGETNQVIYTAPTPVANKNGTYSASFMFTIAQNYIVNVKLNGLHVKDSPVEGFKVKVGKAQARWSELVSHKSPLIAGYNYTFKVQAKDIFENVAVAPNDIPELFSYELIGV